MDLPKSRKEFVCIDNSDVCYKNERLEDQMRRQVLSFSRDEHQSFLNRQSEIARVLENLYNLQAFGQPVKNTAGFRLAANFNDKCSVPMRNYVIEKLTNQESNTIYPESGPLGLKRGKNSAAIHRLLDKNSYPPVTYLNGNRYCRIASGMDSPTNRFERRSPFDISRSDSVKGRPSRSRISESSDLQQQKFFKTSPQFGSHIKGDTSIVTERPSSRKEQWAGLRDGVAQKINSSVAVNWSRFRSANTRRNCTVVCQSRFVEALPLSRLQEIYILEEPEVEISVNRRSNLVQNLLLLNQKRDETVQKKVKKFLLEVGENRRKVSVCTKVTNRSPINDTHACR